MVAIRLEDFVDSLYLHQGESVIYINKLNYLKSREKARMGKFIVVHSELLLLRLSPFYIWGYFGF